MHQPDYSTFEYVSAMLSRSAMQTLARRHLPTGSMAVSDNFFDQFADLLERLTNYSFVLLVDDVNIHLDDDTSTDTIKLNEILDEHNFTQHVQCPTHVGGHLPDVFLTRESPSYVRKMNGGLSDHSMITGSAYLLGDGCDDAVTRCARSWRGVRSSQSVLVLSPPSDPDELFTVYHRTLTSLLDQHAPVLRRRAPSRRSAPWYDKMS